MKHLHVRGMHGLGDNLHQRAIIRELLARGREIWLETPWPCVYHDLVGPNLHLIGKTSFLRTQKKNAVREAAAFSNSLPPPGTPVLQISYSPADVRACGSVFGAMAKACKCSPAGDFRLPVRPEWQAKADRLIAEWKPSRPLMFYRPLVERSEWGGCPARNPDHAAYQKLFASIRSRYFVVSIADLEPGKEWLATGRETGDVVAHGGEFDFETLAALAMRSAIVFSSPGFAVILAQAVGTPVVCTFGGYENSSSFTSGARFAPYLGIDPIEPCQCFSHTHACRKAIDLPAAKARLLEFVNETADHRASAA